MNLKAIENKTITERMFWLDLALERLYLATIFVGIWIVLLDLFFGKMLDIRVLEVPYLNRIVDPAPFDTGFALFALIGLFLGPLKTLFVIGLWFFLAFLGYPVMSSTGENLQNALGGAFGVEALALSVTAFLAALGARNQMDRRIASNLILLLASFYIYLLIKVLGSSFWLKGPEFIDAGWRENLTTALSKVVLSIQPGEIFAIFFIVCLFPFLWFILGRKE